MYGAPRRGRDGSRLPADFALALPENLDEIAPRSPDSFERVGRRGRRRGLRRRRRRGQGNGGARRAARKAKFGAVAVKQDEVADLLQLLQEEVNQEKQQS